MRGGYAYPEHIHGDDDFVGALVDVVHPHDVGVLDLHHRMIATRVTHTCSVDIRVDQLLLCALHFRGSDSVEHH